MSHANAVKILQSGDHLLEQQLADLPLPAGEFGREQPLEGVADF